MTTTTPTDHYPRGTTWVDDATGTIYRLRDYRTDWKSDDLTATIPSYTTSYAEGGFSNADTLPEGARLLWTPQVRQDSDHG